MKYKSLLVALMLAVGVFGAVAVSAQTVESLQQMINQLMQQISALQGGSTTGASTGVSFAKDLTLGSRGDDVTNLQKFLEGKSFLTMPVGTAYGYFGQLTKKALAAYQAANGITPAAGYFGPKTRAAVNAAAVVVVPPVVVPPTTTTTTPGTGTSQGAEGDFTVKIYPTPANSTSITAGNDKAVYAVEITAKDSDMTVDRMDLQMLVKKTNSSGTEINPANFVKSIKAYDGSTLLVEKAVSTSDFDKDNGIYHVRLSGINFKVTEGSRKVLTIKVDTMTGLDTARYLKVGLYGNDAIRATDTLGINNTGTISDVREFTFKTGGDSTVTVTTSSVNPADRNVAVDDDNGIDDVTMLVFNAKSTVGDSTITEIVATTSSSVATSAPTSLKLYDGDTLIDSRTVSANENVVFSDLSIDVAKDKTKTLTLKADFPALARGTATATLLSSLSSFETPDASETNFSGSDLTSKVVTLLGKTVNVAFVSGSVSAPITISTSGTTTSMSGTLKLTLVSNGGDLVEPKASDFAVKAATTTGGTAITVNTVGFTVSPNNTNNVIPENTTATVTLTPTLKNADVTYSGTYFFYVDSVKWQIVDETAVTQTTGLEDFQTSNSEFFSK